LLCNGKKGEYWYTSDEKGRGVVLKLTHWMASSIIEKGHDPIDGCPSMTIILVGTAWCFCSMYVPNGLHTKIQL